MMLKLGSFANAALAESQWVHPLIVATTILAEASLIWMIGTSCQYHGMGDLFALRWPAGPEKPKLKKTHFPMPVAHKVTAQTAGNWEEEDFAPPDAVVQGSRRRVDGVAALGGFPL